MGLVICGMLLVTAGWCKEDFTDFLFRITDFKLGLLNVRFYWLLGGQISAPRCFVKRLGSIPTSLKIPEEDKKIIKEWLTKCSIF
jgi:hypothetical protein